MSGFSVLTHQPLLRTHRAATHFMAHSDTLSLEHGVLAVSGASLLLWLWNKLSGLRKEARCSQAANYALHFGLSELHLHVCRLAQTCIVHHDDDGRIVAIETAAPLPPARAEMGNGPARTVTDNLSEAA